MKKSNWTLKFIWKKNSAGLRRKVSYSKSWSKKIKFQEKIFDKLGDMQLEVKKVWNKISKLDLMNLAVSMKKRIENWIDLNVGVTKY